MIFKLSYLDICIYLISNLFRICVLHRFMHIFFDEEKVSKNMVFWGFVLYFIFNSSLYLFFFSPKINIITNIFSLFLLACLFKGSISKKMFSVALIYAVNLVCENVAFRGLSLFGTPNRNSGTISSSLLMLMIISIFDKIVDIKNNIRITILDCISIFFVPLISIFISTLMLKELTNNFYIILIAFGLLLMNIMIFYLYDILLKSYQKKYENRILIQQNEAWENQFKIMEQSQNNLKKLRHDMRNHISTLQILLKEKEVENAQEYLNDMQETFTVQNQYVNTGNKEIDSILNYKFYAVYKNQIEIQTKIQVPEKLNFRLFDLNIILCNLIDNALEALLLCEEKKMKIEIVYEKNILYITVMNSYSGGLNKKEEKLMTTKSDSENHGLGLENVRGVVEKYKGEMLVDYDKKRFIVKIMLFNSLDLS